MGTHIRTLETRCTCGTAKVEVHMKNPFIDDFMDECPKCEPGSALRWLTSCARSVARREHEEDSRN